MILNGIQFRRESGSAWQNYRFQGGASPYWGCTAVFADGAQLTTLMNALKFAFTGEPQSDVAEASVEFSDPAGNSWALLRTQDGLRCFRDRASVDSGEAFAELKRTLFDDETAAGAGLCDWVGFHEITSDDKELHKKPYAGAESSETPARETSVAEARIKALAVDVQETAGAGESLDDQALAKIPGNLQALAAGYHEADRLLHALPEPPDDVSAGDIDGAIEQANAELKLMDDIEAAAAPLLSPADNPVALKEKLAACVGEIDQTLRSFGIEASQWQEESEPDFLEADWRAPLETLTRLEIYGKLVRSCRGAGRWFSHELEPKINDYVENVSRVLRADQAVSDLESCLSTLDLKVNSPAPPPPPEEASSEKTWFDRLKPRQQSTNRENKPEALPGTPELETARLSVEFILQKVRNLPAELENGLETGREKFSALRETTDELEQNYAELKRHWQNVAARCGLPEDMNLYGFLSFLKSRCRLIALFEERKRLTQEVEESDRRMQRLRTLLTEWRQTRGSHRQTDLSERSRLLEEARDVIRYNPPRRSQLENRKNALRAVSATSGLRHDLLQRKAGFADSWRRALEDGGLPFIPLHHSELNKIIEKLYTIRVLWREHHRPEATGDETEFLFAGDQGTPLSTYIWKEPSLTNGQRLELLRHLENSAPEGGLLIATTDRKLAEMLWSMGIGKGRPAESGAQGAKAASGGSKQQKPQSKKGLVTENTRDALSILTGNRHYDDRMKVR